MSIREVCQYLDAWAPVAYKEDYDNVGLLVGNPDQDISSALISLDVTMEVILEAKAKSCNLIIAHHPLIFKGLKKIIGDTDISKMVMEAIKSDIAIYAIHTNLDNYKYGVNYKIANMLGLEDIQVLRPSTDSLQKLTVFVPTEYAEKMQVALSEAGAGKIGNYDHCSFSTVGQGIFRPLASSKPFIGSEGELEKVNETRVEVVFPRHLTGVILKAMKEAHPYEEIAYFMQTTINSNPEIGAGAVGYLPKSMEVRAFLAHLKSSMAARVIRHTDLCFQEITKVAVCGGVGSFLLNDAIKVGAQIFVSADFKYHEFFEAEKKIIIADIGHFESEQYTKDLIKEQLSKKFSNFASYLSEVDTNPIQYFK